MPLLRPMYPMGSFILTFIALSLLHSALLAPRSVTLFYRDFKALLKAGKVVEVGLGERTISGRLIPAGLEGLLPKEKVAELQQFGQRVYRFTYVTRSQALLAVYGHSALPSAPLALQEDAHVRYGVGIPVL
jgi:hypothetical protein